MSRIKCSLLSSTILVTALLTLISGLQITNVRSNARKDQPRKNEQGQCSHLRTWWMNRGLEIAKLPKLSLKNESLQTCGQGLSCCTPAIEKELLHVVGSGSVGMLDEKLEEMKQWYSSVISRYDSFCQELIQKSSKDLNDMFVKTYGQLYTKESRLFTGLFKQLTSYYRGQDLDLIMVFENFFKTLMQKMFILLNAHYSFDKRYLNCVVDKMHALQPFDDMPQKLSNQVKRAMVAARTFQEGLVVGRELVTALLKVRPSQPCVDAHVRMTVCSTCSGHLRPCNIYCHGAMDGCFTIYDQLNQPWNGYLEQMMKVLERLHGPFNLVSIILPINVKISEAIMTYQERNDAVNKKVFMGCGEPSLETRQKRSFSSEGGIVRSGGNADRSGSGGDIDKILQDIREGLLRSEELFLNLTSTLCAPSAPRSSKNSPNSTASDNNCWSGPRHWKINSGHDLGASKSEGEEGQESIPRDDQSIKEQIHKLSSVTTKLGNSYNGLDVPRGSRDLEGSGEGDPDMGSGYDVDVEDGDDDEYDDMEEEEEEVEVPSPSDKKRGPGGDRDRLTSKMPSGTVIPRLHPLTTAFLVVLYLVPSH